MSVPISRKRWNRVESGILENNEMLKKIIKKLRL